MPQAIAAALVAIWPVLAGTAATVLSYAIVVGAYYAYATYQARAARAAFNDSLKDRLVMTATTDAARSRVYGRVRNVDGILFKATHGSKSKFYTFVVAVAGHEVDAIETVYFNDSALTLDGSGYVTSDPWKKADPKSESVAVTLNGSGNGSVVLAHAPIGGVVAATQLGTGETQIALSVSMAGLTANITGGDPALGTAAQVDYQWAQDDPKARVRKYLGTATQDLSTDLIALGVPGVTSAHKFRGIACLLVTLEYDVDVFVQGVPSMSAVMRGAKCYDPRTGLTAWTRNPALIARDWATNPQGGGAGASELVEASFTIAANACDVATTFTTAAGTTSEPAYLCDIVASTSTDPAKTLQEITAAMAGKYAWSGGLLRIKAGAHQAAVATIDESWLSGAEAIEITSGVSRIDLVNIFRPSIADAAQSYIVTPTESVRAPAYITADGQELPREITLLGVTDAKHAQHVCGAMLRDARQALTVKLPCNMRAYPLEVFDVVAISLPRFGWTAKLFEIVYWSFAPTGGVVITAKETAASIWDPASLFTLIDAEPNTSLPLPWVVPAPTGLAIVSGTTALSDGAIITRVKATWDATTTVSVAQSGQFELQYWPVADALPAGDWQSILAPGDATELVLTGIRSGAWRFRLRQINSIGVRSRWGAQVVHIVANPPPSIADWTDIPGRPLLFRVLAIGGVAGGFPSGNLGLSNGETGASLQGVLRSYTLVKIRRSDGVLTYAQTFDVYGAGAITAGRDAAALAAALDGTTAELINVLYTHDEPRDLRMTGGLPEAIYRAGGSRAVFGSPEFQYRSAYCLIGIGGCGEGNGFEAYQGAVGNDPDAWVDVAFQLKGGNMIVGGGGATPRTIRDYSYIGTLDATTDLSLVARGNAVVAGNFGAKLFGAPAWDSDVYSRDKAFGACFASAAVVDTVGLCMFGLNTDPTTNASYETIDYAWYVNGGSLPNTADVYESGAGVAMNTPIVAGDVLSVVYDGWRIRYLKNGVVLRTVSAPPDQSFAFDSSFYSLNSALRNIRFGQLSANDWAAIGGVNVTTSQIAANAATDVYATNDAGPVSIGPLTPFVNRKRCSVTFTPPISGRLIVTGTLEAVRGGVSKSVIGTIVEQAGSTEVTTGRVQPSTVSGPHIARGVYDVVGGVSLTASIVAAVTGDNTNYITMQDMFITCELIKR